MFLSIIKPLIVNYMIIFSFTASSNFLVPFRRDIQYRKKEQLMFAIIGSIAALLCMLYPIEVLWDTNFDLRMIIIILLTLYRGKWVGFFCFLVVSIGRYFVGGQFVFPGILINLIAFLAGLIFRKKFLQASNKVKVLFAIFLFFTTLSLMILKLLVSFLPATFYVIYFSLFLSTLLIVILTVEKFIKLNQQIDEAFYLENLKTVGHMAAAFAHEIRNPLTTVRGFIQYLSTNNRHHELPQFSKLILEELDRTNTIITDFLSLSKPGYDARKTYVVESILKETIDLIYPTAQLQNIKIEWDLSSSHLIHVDKKLLKQTLLNIFKNSMEAIENKHQHTDGKIFVTTATRPNEKVLILIEDNGIGLTPQEIKQMGLPFYTTKAKGTGIGTIVINKLVRDMNGTIHYYSQKNQWTRVEILLPIVEK